MVGQTGLLKARVGDTVTLMQLAARGLNQVNCPRENVEPCVQHIKLQFRLAIAAEVQ